MYSQKLFSLNLYLTLICYLELQHGMIKPCKTGTEIYPRLHLLAGQAIKRAPGRNFFCCSAKFFTNLRGIFAHKWHNQNLTNSFIVHTYYVVGIPGKNHRAFGDRICIYNKVCTRKHLPFLLEVIFRLSIRLNNAAASFEFFRTICDNLRKKICRCRFEELQQI